MAEPGWYKGELLDLAYDLGSRLLPAFNTPLGIPVHRVNLRTGIPKGEVYFRLVEGGELAMACFVKIWKGRVVARTPIPSEKYFP